MRKRNRIQPPERLKVRPEVEFIPVPSLRLFPDEVKRKDVKTIRDLGKLAAIYLVW